VRARSKSETVREARSSTRAKGEKKGAEARSVRNSAQRHAIWEELVCRGLAKFHAQVRPPQALFPWKLKETEIS